MANDRFSRFEIGIGHLSDALCAFVGDYIGSGCYRHVFEYAPDPKNWVVKLEGGDRSFANVIEWELWREVDGSPASKFFAPCGLISPGGGLLLQRRTKPLDLSKLPEKVPYFFGDLKPGNYGMIGRRIVCHDYGNHMIADGIPANPRMVKAKWRV